MSHADARRATEVATTTLPAKYFTDLMMAGRTAEEKTPPACR